MCTRVCVCRGRAVVARVWQFVRHTFCPAQVASSSTAKYLSVPPPLVTNVAQRMRPREGGVVVTVVVSEVVGVVVVVDVGVLVAVDVAVVVGVVVGVVHSHEPDRDPS